MKTMVMSTHKIMSAINISEKNSIEKIPRKFFFPSPDISDKRSLLFYLLRCMNINNSLTEDVALPHKSKMTEELSKRVFRKCSSFS